MICILQINQWWQKIKQEHDGLYNVVEPGNKTNGDKIQNLEQFHAPNHTFNVNSAYELIIHNVQNV